MLAAHGVARSYGRRVALAPTDLELRAGEVVALVGPNGAGKSTLLTMLAGALPPSSGSVSASDRELLVGWAPQRPAIYGHLSARENLVLFARLADEQDPEAAADTLLDRMGLPAGDQRAAQLSVGNQQRLNLALGLVGDPSVLLLDEPTASLDPAQRRRLWELLEEVRGDGGSVLLATHAFDEVERLADRVVVLLDGKVAFAGTPPEVTEAMPELAGS